MTWAVHLLVSLLVVLGGAWLVVVVAVLASKQRGHSMGDVLHILFDTLRLIRKLARDPSLPRTVRWRLYVALAYNIQPFNIVPDFIPVVGLVDNLIVVGWALRSALRKAGPETVSRHWDGDPQGLATVYRIAGLTPPTEPSPPV